MIHIEDVQYRHELKHVITYSDMLSIRARLSAVARPDSHAVDGKYFIRSLYFDNASDKALREKIDGVNYREKFRIRYYDKNPSVIHLEKKSKRNGLGTKFKASLTAQQAQSIVDGDTDWMLNSDQSLIQELYCKMKYQGLRPKTIVDYTREPYIFGPGNVRVTLDYDIRTGLWKTDFLDRDCITIPAAKGICLMEVKWDNFLPEIIRDAVQLTSCRTQAFSKYAVCRLPMW